MIYNSLRLLLPKVIIRVEPDEKVELHFIQKFRKSKTANSNFYHFPAKHYGRTG